ncbi:MAG TPA: hypothetical protein VFE47_03325 [Tepidisphaeraceae bacterium]|jgi:hypothetical protein|nr:hypothetical protein [Tepidisphaeraceae bacterium]
MLDIEQVTKDRAKALGMEIRATAAGPNLVRVELAFEPRGELKHFTRVDLEMRDGEKLLISSTLKEEQTKPGKIIVSFAADRGKLDQMTLRVVELTECARAATPLIPTHAKLDQ